MNTILVIGGAGYIGSHVCKALAAAGWRPIVYDDLSRGHAQAVQWGPLIRGTMQDGAKLAQALIDHRPQAVIHLAGLIEVGESVLDPLRYWQENTATSASLLQSILCHHPVPVVFSSSAAVYGNGNGICLTENAPLAPVNPYGHTKLAVEHMLSHCGAAHGLKWMALRYFNAAGASPDGEIGEAHQPESHLIPRVLMALSGEIEHFHIFGDDYPTPDGTALRDYVHVCDLADAHVQAVQYLLDGGSPQPVNIGLGHPISVREVVSAIEQVTGQAVPFRIAARRAGDPALLVADVTRAATLLGFAPRYRTVADIVRTAWAWHRGARQDWLAHR